MSQAGLIGPNRETWVKMIPDVERCADEFEGLLKKYGAQVFAVNVVIFYENMPDVLLVLVEQLRFQNSKFKEDGGLIGQHFKPTGVAAADGKFQVTDKVEPNEPDGAVS